MLITVAVCTRDRAASLERALGSLQALTIPAGVEWELVVVDNGSSDSTASLLRTWDARLPLRATFEPVPGLSHARNRAVQAARGAWIVWIDDDAVADPGWLDAYARAFRAFPDAAFFGGPIAASFEGTPPDWLPRVLDRVPGAFGVRQLGPDPAGLGPDQERLPFGGNYGVRTDVQRRYPYDPELGVQPGKLARGEETAVFLAMLAEGQTGRWVPEARVIHSVAPEKQTERYIRSFYRLDAATRSGAGGARVRRLRLLLRALQAEARFRLLRRVAPAPRWIGALVAASEAWGTMDRYRPDPAAGDR